MVAKKVKKKKKKKPTLKTPMLDETGKGDVSMAEEKAQAHSKAGSTGGQVQKTLLQEGQGVVRSTDDPTPQQVLLVLLQSACCWQTPPQSLHQWPS
jgi:hypothetical protein